ncbi:MAG: glutamate racemase [Sulfurovum sp.]|nr:glutamate racemase [Sulfurovum sp.]
MNIGVFDSGLGGLTVVKALQSHIQNAHIFYLADTQNAPYGDKTSAQILQYSLDISHYLIETYQIDALILACNTATSFAIESLRQKYPSLIIIGTEPGLKPAITQSKTGNIGVLATPATLQGKKYHALVERLSQENEVYFLEQACGGLVEEIEKGVISTPKIKSLLTHWLLPMKAHHVDTIVLGCTHYPLVGHIIKEIMHPNITLIDTAEAIAKRLLKLLLLKGHQNSGILELNVESTGDIEIQLMEMIVDKPVKYKRNRQL